MSIFARECGLFGLVCLKLTYLAYPCIYASCLTALHCLFLCRPPSESEAKRSPAVLFVVLQFRSKCDRAKRCSAGHSETQDIHQRWSHSAERLTKEAK